MKLVVLSDKGQYELFIKDGGLSADWQILSDNPRFYEYLRSQRIPFEGIDEFLIETEWEQINAWATGAMNEWNRFCVERKLFSQVNWSSMIRNSLTCILIQIVKNQRMAEVVLARYCPQEMIVFETKAIKKYPLSSGNMYLNYFLTQLVANRNIKVRSYATNAKEHDDLKGDFPVPRLWFKKGLQPVKYLLELLSGLLWTRFGKADVVAFGSLRHLGAVLKELKQRGVRVAIYDFEYHGEQLGFAIGNGLSYWLPSYFLKEQDKNSQNEWAASQYREFQDAFQKASSEGIFCFDGQDYGRIVFDLVVSNMEDYFLKFSKERVIYQTIIATRGCKRWIVDDDYSLKGSFAAAFLNMQGVEVYCISHANLAVNFAVPARQRLFAQSTTLVHSEHEKTMYASRGWDPQRIVVTGSPRHDRIFQKEYLDQLPRKETGGSVRLLFQATHIWPSSPDLRGYLGCHITNTGDFQAPGFKKIVEAMAGLPIELVVKPHDAESVISWKEFIKGTGAGAKITIANHAQDFMTLLADCDGLVSGCWSTTLIEAALAGKPSFVVVGKPIANPELDRFAQNGFCQIFHDAEGLHTAFKRLCEVGWKEYFQGIPKTQEEFYLGYRDGESTRRVVELIQGKP